jgi:hypothetical protein
MVDHLLKVNSLFVRFVLMPILALSAVYPEHAGQFQKPKKAYWKDLNNQRGLLESISKLLNIQRLEDWKSVTTKQLVNLGGGPVVSQYGSLYRGIVCF